VRPGENITGLSTQGTEVAGKRLALLREIVPGLRRLAIMFNVGFPSGVQEGGEVQSAARRLGLDPVPLEIRRAEDIAPAFESLKDRADALYVVGDALVFTHRVRITTLTLIARLPTIYFVREYVEAGGLMSYGPNVPDLFRRAANMVDKILRGARPGELPIEQPTKFDLVINLTTAKGLGLTIPESFLLLAESDRIDFKYAALHMSLPGTKRTSQHARPMSAFGSKADIRRISFNVRLWSMLLKKSAI
jgi:ABC-type uncharacterized transport system substrate-binding protein